MIISKAEITNFRNLSAVKLELNPEFNIFYGNNGSGKTSLLEALYYLGMGRSFRSPLVSRIISYDQDHFVVFGLIEDKQNSKIPIGIERNQDGSGKMRIAGQEVTTRAQLAEALPLQLINTNGYRLLESGPRYRRQFMDWGMFHVEHAFLSCWRQVQRILKQRNAALRCNKLQQLPVWNDELANASMALHELRVQYMQMLTPILQELLQQLLSQAITIEYYPGWSIDKDLSALFAEKLPQDLQLGYTGIGPQKADLRFKINKTPAQDALSRGQQKLLVCALQLAQGLLLQQNANKGCLYLIDDLPSELDRNKQQCVINILQNMQVQTFITGINKPELKRLFPKSVKIKMFHVEQGRINE